MKFITFFHTQYGSSSLNWTNLYNTVATDFVFIPPSYAASYPSSHSTEMAAAIKKLIDGRSGKTTNIWIGTPGITSANFSIGYTSSNLTTFLKAVYNALGSTYQAKVAGAYMNQEAFYGDMDYNNPLGGSKPANKQLKIMSEIKTYVKNGNIKGKQLLWIPYYGKGTNAAKIIKDIGYAADKVQIFDYCIMQPGYLFNPSECPGNFDGICASMRQNKVCYRDGVAVIASKVSTTKIGFEMEYDSRYVNNYQAYVNAFSSYRSYPYGFYWAGYADDATFNAINSFMR
ncbi:DUF4855 domain-containing protein [Butyricicoccus sp. 1XD8-22]|nr:DUF4855 domain-containing protein [Butyricicoccus sp. 1XD8-22]